MILVKQTCHSRLYVMLWTSMIVRDQIWDHLFKTKAIHPLDEIAALVGCDSALVRSAIDHEWFRVADDRVSIAYVAR